MDVVRAAATLMVKDPMKENKSAEARPLWVKIALWGVPGRSAAWAFFWLSMALAIGGIIYGFWDRRFFAGAMLFVAAAWYYLAIRWADLHGGWT
ncbi:MAG TPA: hypothetical protein VGX70_19095 [Gemmataceae bacterium]|nr:hypothetical protein [Gemmataceae bacterium]